MFLLPWLSGSLSNNRTRVCKSALVGCYKIVFKLLATALHFQMVVWLGLEACVPSSPLCRTPGRAVQGHGHDPESTVSQWCIPPSCWEQDWFQGASLSPPSRRGVTWGATEYVRAPPRLVYDDDWDATQAQPKPVVYITKTCHHQSCFPLMKSHIQPHPRSTNIWMPGGLWPPLVDDAWALPPWAIPYLCTLS